MRNPGLSRATSTLTADEISLMKGMLKRKDRQVDIALWFGVNQAFVNRLNKGKFERWKAVPSALDQTLPPPGPYALVTQAVADKSLVNAAIVLELENILTRFKGGVEAASKSVHKVHAQSEQSEYTANAQNLSGGTGHEARH